LNSCYQVRQQRENDALPRACAVRGPVADTGTGRRLVVAGSGTSSASVRPGRRSVRGRPAPRNRHRRRSGVGCRRAHGGDAVVCRVSARQRQERHYPNPRRLLGDADASRDDRRRARSGGGGACASRQRGAERRARVVGAVRPSRRAADGRPARVPRPLALPAADAATAHRPSVAAAKPGGVAAAWRRAAAFRCGRGAGAGAACCDIARGAWTTECSERGDGRHGGDVGAALACCDRAPAGARGPTRAGAGAGVGSTAPTRARAPCAAIPQGPGSSRRARSGRDRADACCVRGAARAPRGGPGAGEPGKRSRRARRRRATVRRDRSASRRVCAARRSNPAGSRPQAHTYDCRSCRAST
jgi:hypothetical protein